MGRSSTIPSTALQPLRLADRPRIESLLAGVPSELGARTFAGVYMWRELFEYVCCSIDGYFCLFARYGPHTYMPWPPLPGPGADPAGWRTVVGAAFDLLYASPDGGAAARIEGVGESEAEAFRAAGYEVLAHATEYVYRRDDLVGLRGNAYKSKRWAWNDFVRQGVSHLGPLTDRHVEECLELYRRWRTEKARRGATAAARAMADDAESAHRVALTERAALGLSGLVVTVAGRISGYTLGGPVGPSTFGVWLEIADPAWRGLAAYLFREFCRAQTGVEWITAFDDSGIESLARAKRSYRPARFVRSYMVRLPLPSGSR